MPGRFNYGLRSILLGAGGLAVLLALLSLLWWRQQAAPGVLAQATPQYAAAFAQGLTFEPAAGDAMSPPRFIARGDRYVARLHPAGAQIGLPGGDGTVARVGLRLVDSNGDAAGSGAGPVRGWSHYYTGDDPAAWREHVPNYGRVEYAAVYPGIDLAWHGAQGELEFDFIVAPGANPGRIRIAFDDIETLRLAPSGELVLATTAGELTLRPPLAYQERAGRREPVEAAFEPAAAAGVRFRVGPYDPSRRLVIDPIITFADYLGGSADDTGVAIAVDAAGNRYVTGGTASVDFADEAKPANTGIDAYIAKLDPDGTRVYVTFIGDVGTDRSNAIAVDGGGRAHVAGDTDSSDLPTTPAAAQAATGGGQDAFVARLAADGTLDYLSYLGGAGLDTARALALGVAGDIYVGGSTQSEDLPTTPDALQDTLAGEGDGFVARISALGGQVYATYLGGEGADSVTSLALDEASAIYAGGSTSSELFPTAGGLGPFLGEYQGGGTDGFVAKLAANGATLDYATYLGGNGSDSVLALAVGSVADVDGYAYVTGLTSSSDFPVSDGTPAYRGGTFDAFVARLIPNGSVVDYSTYLGGNGEDQGLAIAVAGDGEAVVGGVTLSDDLGLTQPLQVRRLGIQDGFITQVRFASNVISQLFSTYLGGLGDDAVTALAVAADGAIHAAGSGDSDNLPAVDATQGQNAGGRDAFVMRIERDPSQLLPDLRVDIAADPVPVPRRRDLLYALTVDNEGAGAASGVLVQVDGSNLSSLSSPNTDCASASGVSILCQGGDVSANGFIEFDIRATTDEIGPAILTATLIRADQSGISVGSNSASLERLVVDDSDKSAGLSWELLVLAAGASLLRRRRERRGHA